MPDNQKTKLRLEIAHALLIDIVGYSKLLINQQSELLQKSITARYPIMTFGWTRGLVESVQSFARFVQRIAEK